jgi:CHASE1-domain containing sensor protein
MQNQSPSSKTTRYLQHWQVFSVFVLCLLLTIAIFSFSKENSRQKKLALATGEAVEYQRRLEEGFRVYLHLNRAITGFFAGSGRVTAQEFDEFMEAVNAMETHPGLAYIRYIPRIAMNDIGAFETKIRQALPSFSIHGSHVDPDYVYPGLYGYPYDEGSKQFTGYDFSGNRERWDAMRKARDWGKSIITKKSTYLSDPSKKILFPYSRQCTQLAKSLTPFHSGVPHLPDLSCPRSTSISLSKA